MGSRVGDTYIPDHPQVPFVTSAGVDTVVDKGILPVLEKMRNLGVETQYSCQGDMTGAYVLADRLTFTKLKFKILKNYFLRRYSDASQLVVRDFIKGYRLHEFAIFIGKGTSASPTRQYKIKLSGGKKSQSSFCIEHLYSYRYGFRMVARWPSTDSDRIFRLLNETK